MNSVREDYRRIHHRLAYLLRHRGEGGDLRGTWKLERIAKRIHWCERPFGSA